jgi:hypothetical protein
MPTLSVVLLLVAVTTLTFSHRSTIICTMRSTRSKGGHISVHVPTGVIALSRVVFFSGSARKPFCMASRRSSSRRFLSYSREIP